GCAARTITRNVPATWCRRWRPSEARSSTVARRPAACRRRARPRPSWRPSASASSRPSTVRITRRRHASATASRSWKNRRIPKGRETHPATAARRVLVPGQASSNRLATREVCLRRVSGAKEGPREEEGVKCDCCAKPATIHQTSVIQGKKKEMHLCQECAEAQQILQQEELNLSVILQTVIGQHVSPVADELARLSCPLCKIKFMEFR